MDFYYHNAWRMDWGFGNPNKTATFIACLMLAVWSIAGWWRRGYWFALVIQTALAWCLVETYSRGGMLALLAGGAVLLAWAPRPWPRPRAIAGVVTLWIIGLFILSAKAEARYGQGLFSDDQSINSRFVVWKHFPGMLAAAPWGWGNAGDAYTQWFQPVGQSINYLNLLNSHFTVMADEGWAFSVFYMGAWMAVILICWPVRGGRMGAVPLAVWVAFGVGGFFSQVEDSIVLWIAPLFLLGFAACDRYRLNDWPAAWSLGAAAFVSICLVAAVVVIGGTTALLPIKTDGRAVMLGLGPNKTVIFIDRAVMGKLYGHSLRKYWMEGVGDIFQKSYIITESPNYIMPRNVGQIIASGDMARHALAARGLSACDQVILINPECYPEEMRWEANGTSQTRVYFGEYSQSPSRSSWAGWPKARCLVINGAGNFVPAWPGAIWKPAGT